jgi:hypothetical protein
MGDVRLIIGRESTGENVGIQGCCEPGKGSMRKEVLERYDMGRRDVGVSTGGLGLF